MVAKKKSTSKSAQKQKSLDQDILTLLDKQKHNHLLDYEIADKLEKDLNTITIAVRRLKEMTKVRTKLVMDESRWVTQVKKIHDYNDEQPQTDGKSSLKWEPYNDLPCYICKKKKKCDEGQKQYNPRTCPWLSDWLLCCIKGEDYTANPFHPEYEIEPNEKNKEKKKKKGKKKKK